MARLSRLALLVAVVLAMGLGACGGDDDSGDDNAQAPAKTTPTATEPTPAEAQEALKDTSQRPVIPRPTGSPPRRLVVEDIVKGKGKAAKKGDTVIVHYVGMNFSNGQEFDASWDRGQPFPVTIGQTQVIEGWTRGLVGIRKGGRRKLTIPPELGYGPNGYPPSIPPNETLIFVVDAVEVR
ncbi:MAG TPA: FKBP-type peptidyl-prolyl cis-trans isomerase [Thermoleophilaceae bacterium]|nr:FKBP-type peptidyl-prolyl cis-trans isomerase [Thermoleophilaceae bacterium]